MPGSAAPLRVALLACALGAALAAQAVAAADCRPLDELMPEGTDGLDRVSSHPSGSGPVWRWSVKNGGVLELRLRTARTGSYEISLRALADEGKAVVGGSLWGAPLHSQGSERFGVGKEGALTLDPVSLGPGHHPLQLRGLESGSILLDCVSVRRTGDWKPRSPRTEPAPPSGEQAFLGVQLGAPRQDGVAIDRVYPGTAAAEHGMESDDVVLELGGTSTTTLARLQNAIGSREPGDVVEVVLLRAGERKSLQVRLGTRPGDRVLRSEEAQEVLEFLQLRAGRSVADLGCGSGWLSEAMAGKLAGSATVYAVEIQERHIIEQYARAVPGVIPVLSLPDDVSLPENSVELAVLHDVASHIDSEARPSFYDSVRLALRPGGRLAVFGPHGEAEEMLRVLHSNGFVALEKDALSAMSPTELDARLGEGILFRPR